MIQVVQRASAEDALEAAATHIGELIAGSLATRGAATLALSGGQYPAPMLEHLATQPLDWNAVQVFQVDERVAPAGDAERNLSMVEASFTARVPARLHAMPVENEDLEDGAREYDELLPEALDVVHLGLGHDGHTASLFPDAPELGITDRRVAVTAEHVGHRRMTLTFPVLDAAAERVWLVLGDDKRDAVTRLLASDPSIPAGCVTTERSTLFTDIDLDHAG
jgi:6-phosphogluconolactonase